MPVSDFVTISITANTLGLAQAGFGVPMLLGYNGAFGAAKIRFYGDLDAVGLDFTTDEPEYLAASAMFAQTPRPSQIAIGVGSNLPTKSIRFTPTAINSHDYTVTVKGTGVTTTTVTYTSDASALVTEITAGLKAALDAVVGANYTTTDNGTSLDIDSTVAGDWFSLKFGAITDGKVEDLTADPGVAADLTAIQDENPGWYAVHTAFNSEAYVVAAAAWANARTKIYVAAVQDTESVTLAVGGGDALDTLKTNGYGRVGGVYHEDPSAFADAAIMGRMLPTDVGSSTWAIKNLSGVPAMVLTGTHVTNLQAKNANYYYNVGGLGVFAFGTTADGDYFDVQRGIDWLEDNISVGIFNLLFQANKVPYTDPGAAQVEAVVRASLQRAVARTILSNSPEPVVTVPLVATISAANKAARILPDVKFSGTLAGAIHKVNVFGNITV